MTGDLLEARTPCNGEASGGSTAPMVHPVIRCNGVRGEHVLLGVRRVGDVLHRRRRRLHLGGHAQVPGAARVRGLAGRVLRAGRRVRLRGDVARGRAPLVPHRGARRADPAFHAGGARPHAAHRAPRRLRRAAVDPGGRGGGRPPAAPPPPPAGWRPPRPPRAPPPPRGPRPRGRETLAPSPGGAGRPAGTARPRAPCPPPPPA